MWRHIHRATRRFNDWLALRIVQTVGTMSCAYLFAALALVSLPDALHAGRAATIAWVAQTFLQLVLLSVIMVGQNLIGRNAETRAQQDHEAIMTELDLLKRLHHDVHEAMGLRETAEV